MQLPGQGLHSPQAFNSAVDRNSLACGTRLCGEERHTAPADSGSATKDASLPFTNVPMSTSSYAVVSGDAYRKNTPDDSNILSERQQLHAATLLVRVGWKCDVSPTCPMPCHCTASNA